jgi:hypothetical protein
VLGIFSMSLKICNVGGIHNRFEQIIFVHYTAYLGPTSLQNWTVELLLILVNRG